MLRVAVHASWSLQVRAQAPGIPAVIVRSHCSPISTTPSPHTTGQSRSVAAVQPGGQQPSPLTQPVMVEATHLELHVIDDPARVIVVQEPAAAQLVGQEPLAA
jgi:hypothetical protein